MDTESIAGDKKPSLTGSLFTNKCPRCRRGNMFTDPNPYHLKSLMKMPDCCSVCGQKFDLEVGFYYGTSYVSYALTVATSAATIIAWFFFAGLFDSVKSLLTWLAVNAMILVLLQPLFMRWARAIWIAFFIRYDPKWKETPALEPERINDELKNGW